jgi:predicted KAP-like P-loop ATPase
MPKTPLDLIDLSADRPLTDPNDDLFGHAPFARHLADAIRRHQGPESIVLALYGPWGAGKSTVLAYVQHYLNQAPAAERPLVVPFNPWWFSGQDNLAAAFLGQLQAVLPARHAGLRGLGRGIAAFCDALGGFGGSASVARGPRVWPARRASGDVNALKQAIAGQLASQGQRILVVVDDIDRLAPDEVRQLFTAVKALADFPYITYLLAFDREVASTAISEQTGLPGERYLEKIIQVPFQLPHVDREVLRRALFTRLDAVMAGTPPGRFDSAHWAHVFFAGLDPLFQVPRDIVRLVNCLAVTYPAVRGEVNPVDFIAIECLRVFVPAAYDAIRMESAWFIGPRAADAGDDREAALAFHREWLEKVPAAQRDSTRTLMRRLFPKLDAVWSDTRHPPEAEMEWRRNLRICAPEVFPAYFRLTLPEGSISRSEVDALLAARRDAVAFGAVLRRAAQQKGTDGVSRVRALLERFVDHVDSGMTAFDAAPVIRGLLTVGDVLLVAGDRVRGGYDFGNESRVARIVQLLLRKVEAHERLPLLMAALKHGQSLRCSQYLVGLLASEAEKAAKGDGNALLSPPEVDELKHAWVRKLEEHVMRPGFIDSPFLADLLSGWRHWGGETPARAWWAETASSNDGLLRLIAAHGWDNGADAEDRGGTRVRVSPRAIEPYTDVAAVADRVLSLLARGAIKQQWRAPAEQFVRECKLPRDDGGPEPVLKEWL